MSKSPQNFKNNLHALQVFIGKMDLFWGTKRGANFKKLVTESNLDYAKVIFYILSKPETLLHRVHIYL